MSHPPIKLADIFRSGFSEYAAAVNKLPYEHYKVANTLMNCHTAALGGHAFRCNECSHTQVAYNSCRNRHCPSCQAAERAKWVEKRVGELLPVPYFHVVFTVPAELNPFALRNKRTFYTILFKAASQTLHACAKRKKYLGADIGFIAVLHTWGQNLLDHPHLHCVVPAGGLSEDRWLNTPNDDFLFPVKVVARLFRGKFLALFREAVRNREIRFHGTLASFETGETSFGRFIDALYKKEWVVYLKPPFAGPEAVLKYLGRYTHRIAIANSRITNVDSRTVSFTWKDYKDRDKQKTMTVSRHEFLRRFLLHVLPKGFVRIRYFGFMGQAVKKDKLQKCRALAGEVTEKQPKEAQPKDAIATTTAFCKRWICPECGKGMLVCYGKTWHNHHVHPGWRAVV